MAGLNQCRRSQLLRKTTWLVTNGLNTRYPLIATTPPRRVDEFNDLKATGLIFSSPGRLKLTR